MPVQVACPCCNKILTSSDDLVGKQAECPFCKVRFQVPPLNSASTPPTGTVPPGATTAQMGPPPVVNRSGNAPPGFGTVSMPAAAGAPPPVAPQPTGTDLLETVSMGGTPIKTVPAAPRPVNGGDALTRRASPKTARPADGATQPPPQKSPKRAKMVAFDPTETRVHLGADGQLPNLVLERGEQKEKTPAESQSSSPMIILVLCASVGLSILMLFLDTSTTTSEAKSKQQARSELETHYISQEPPLERYQLVLRQALQAHSRGDTAEEKRLYRRVLDRLRAESNNDKRNSLTPVRDATDPPNDRHLAEMLSRLLSD